MLVIPTRTDGLAVTPTPQATNNNAISDLSTAPTLLPDGLWGDFDLNMGDDWALDGPDMSWLT
jgi:hypothetical protein